MITRFTAAHRGGSGTPLDGPVDASTIPDAVELAMDAAGFATAHIVGNSLGGFVALQLAARGRVESVVALAPAGGWARGDQSYRETLALYAPMQAQLRGVVANIEALVSTPEGRRRATQLITTNYEHLLTGIGHCPQLDVPTETAHLITGFTAS